MFPYIDQIPGLNRVLRPVADGMLKTYGRIRAHAYDIEDTIVIAANGRGGSTWLTEVLASLPGYTVLWEPLQPGNNPEVLEHGFHWVDFIPRGAEAYQQREYLEEVLKGENLSTRLISRSQFCPLRLLQPQGGYLVKFVNASMLLPWLVDEFPVDAILLIRHPCAVVASQITHPAWGGVTKKNISFPERLASFHPHLVDVFESIETKEELLAFGWAIQTYVSLFVPQPHSWFLVTYEELVTDGHSVIEDIFNYLEHPVPSEAYDQLDIPSATSSSHLRNGSTTGEERLTTWRRRLTASQVDKILRVVHDVGILGYTDDLRPNKDALLATSAPPESGKEYTEKDPDVQP